MPTLDSRTHTLIGPQPTGQGLRLWCNGDRSDDYEALTFGNDSPGGFGPCRFLLRSNPPNFGDAIQITINGQLAWTGKVTNTPGITYYGEHEPTYEVIGNGPGKTEDATAQSSDFAMAFVDRNMSNWFSVDCANWVAPYDGFKLDCTSGDFLRISGGEFAADPMWDAGGMSGYTYVDENGAPVESNTAPSYSEGDFPLTPILWSAFYYMPNQGVTSDTVSMLSCSATYDTLCPSMDVDIPDFGQMLPTYVADPITGLPTDVVNVPELWIPTNVKFLSDMVGMGVPGCVWGGIYAVDTPEELPVRDSVVMFSHDAQVHLFSLNAATAPAVAAEYVPGGVVPPGGETYGPDPSDPTKNIWFGAGGVVINSTAAETVPLEIDCRGKKMLVFYMSYIPLRVPYPAGGGTFDDITKEWKSTGWMASNQYFLKSNSFIQLDNVSVYCNGFSGNDVSAALNLITPGTYPSFTVDSKTSIIVEPFTTKLGAVESLLQLYPAKTVWQYNAEAQLEVAVGSFGTITYDAAEPGVTVEATLKKAADTVFSGIPASMTVVYSAGHGSSDNHTIHCWTAKSITIDADGDPATAGTKSGYLDLSGTSHSGESAMGAGISYIAEIGGSTIDNGMAYEGTISLKSIYGAALIMSGYQINCGAVVGALITSVGVDVSSDTVTLSLGGTGYENRFATSQGQATPLQQRPALPVYSLRRG